MNDSAIDWKVVAYAVGGCWLIFGVTFLLGVPVWFSPLPILVKAVWGGVVYGYVGSTSGRNLEAVFVYWTLFGVWLSWRLHKSERKWQRVIAEGAVLHLVLWAVTVFPMMIVGGR